ncbi:MAG: LapA family protein [Acidimicrobiia bacterium]|nr:LapA family protein [Acidimicrobiia bacterium]
MTEPLDRGAAARAKETPNLWAGPLFFLLLILVPTLILVFSNTASAQLKFAGWGWSAPLWLILLATFLAGIILSRLFSWAWRAFRKRRGRIRADLQAADRVSGT